ncbi:MAG: hypothetical protein ACLRYU_12165 [Coprococcus sp.]
MCIIEVPWREMVSGHICPCLGYHTEWPLYHLADDRAQTHIRDALYILETP